MKYHPLPDALELAVQLKLMDMNASNVTITEEDIEKAVQTSHDIAERGDRLIYKSKKKGETAELFNKLVHAIVILAHVPGGITIFGKHFETWEW